MNYEPVIGLEIHVELATKTKLFCGCVNLFGGDSNSHVCPVCLGLPGVLPVVNEEAIHFLVLAALALDCKIPHKSKFDRKNYFYPDMPKNYQISQYDLPFSQNGKLLIQGGKAIGIERIHLEEDTGKSIHVAPNTGSGEAIVGGRIGQSTYTLLDYNRAGVPLIEIVSKPDIRSENEAVDFLQNLKLILQTLGVSDCKMEEGSMRCDANVSLRPVGSETFGSKVEVKNMNSFRSVKEALIHEIERQTEALQQGVKLVQETRGWDENKKVTFSMRSKEEAHDYRYFPEPDLTPFEIDEKWLSAIRASLPELPAVKKKRYEDTFKLPADDAETLVNSLSLSSFFDEAVKLFDNPKEISNWLRGDVSKYLNEHGIEVSQTKLTPQKLADLLALIGKGTLSGKIAKELLPEIMESGVEASELVKSRGLTQISDEGSLKQLIDEALKEASSSKAIAEYKGGNERALGFLVGAVMKKTQGKANPQIVNTLLREALSKS